MAHAAIIRVISKIRGSTPQANIRDLSFGIRIYA